MLLVKRMILFFLNFCLMFYCVFQSQQLKAQLCASSTVILLDSIIYTEPFSWQLVFEDNFDGTSLDLSNWEQRPWSNGSIDGSDAYRTLNNVTVSPETFYGRSTSAKGVCVITAKKENVTEHSTSWDPSSPIVTYQYTASDVWSKQQFGWGKYEIRCKLPKSKSLWSSFWMYGEKDGIGHEIDGFEFTNEHTITGKYDPNKTSKVAQMHYHRWDKTFTNNSIDHNCGSSVGNSNSTDFSEDFHTFTVIWNRFGIYWYIDNEYKKEAAQWYDINGHSVDINNIKPTQVVLRNDWFPKNPVSIIFALNISKGNDAPDDSSVFPSSLIIDYIRYYTPN